MFDASARAHVLAFTNLRASHGDFEVWEASDHSARDHCSRDHLILPLLCFEVFSRRKVSAIYEISSVLTTEIHGGTMGDDNFGRQDGGGGETRVFALTSRSELTITVGIRDVWWERCVQRSQKFLRRGKRLIC